MLAQSPKNNKKSLHKTLDKTGSIVYTIIKEREIKKRRKKMFNIFRNKENVKEYKVKALNIFSGEIEEIIVINKNVESLLINGYDILEIKEI